MTTSESTTFIIVGLTKEGRKFRPSDWAERLCGVMSAFGAERKMKYSPYVGPGDHNGQKAVPSRDGRSASRLGQRAHIAADGAASGVRKDACLPGRGSARTAGPSAGSPECAGPVPAHG